MRILALILILILILGGTAPLAPAQTSIWGADKGVFRSPASTEEPIAYGWQAKKNASVNFSLLSSQDVIGQSNGTSETYGLSLKSSLNRYHERDEWRNDLLLTEATTKTASIPRFVKSSDELKLSTIYLYFLPKNPRVGPYARAEAAAPLFNGEDVRSEVKTYRINAAGENSSITRQDSSVRLTDGLNPLATKEAVGFFYQPVKEDRLSVEARLGAAALQIKADGGYSVKGVNKDGEVELNPLHDVHQAGLEAGVAIKGKFNQNSGYAVSAESLTPFINNKRLGDERDALRLTNVDGTARLESKLTTWLSTSYDYKLRIQPQLVDRAQQIHMFVLNLNYPPAEAEHGHRPGI
jgi:hypothetical protein